VIGYVSDRIAVMYLGEIVESGPTRAVLREPKHPYTRALLSAVPRVDQPGRHDRVRLTGDLPSPIDPPRLQVHTCCPQAMLIAARANGNAVAPDHTISCHLYGEPSAAIILGQRSPAAAVRLRRCNRRCPGSVADATANREPWPTPAIETISAAPPISRSTTRTATELPDWRVSASTAATLRVPPWRWFAIGRRRLQRLPTRPWHGVVGEEPRPAAAANPPSACSTTSIRRGGRQCLPVAARPPGPPSGINSDGLALADTDCDPRSRVGLPATSHDPPAHAVRHRCGGAGGYCVAHVGVAHVMADRSGAVAAVDGHSRQATTQGGGLSSTPTISSTFDRRPTWAGMGGPTLVGRLPASGMAAGLPSPTGGGQVELASHDAVGRNGSAVMAGTRAEHRSGALFTTAVPPLYFCHGSPCTAEWNGLPDSPARLETRLGWPSIRANRGEHPRSPNLPADRVAESPTRTVLIYGETGTGKAGGAHAA
jgi:oligopeptide/dipeptide ABC transporter ATP-binding protein